MLEQESFLYIDKAARTLSNTSVGAEKVIPPFLDEGYENSITPGWYFFGSFITVCLVLMLLAGWRMYNRLVPILQPTPPAHPEIVVMHQQPSEEHCGPVGKLIARSAGVDRNEASPPVKQLLQLGGGRLIGKHQDGGFDLPGTITSAH